MRAALGTRHRLRVCPCRVNGSRSGRGPPTTPVATRRPSGETATPVAATTFSGNVTPSSTGSPAVARPHGDTSMTTARERRESQSQRQPSRRRHRRGRSERPALRQRHRVGDREPRVRDVVQARIRVLLQTPPQQLLNDLGHIGGQQVPWRIVLEDPGDGVRRRVGRERRRPVNISNSTQPNAQMSVRLSTARPRACSGLI